MRSRVAVILTFLLVICTIPVTADSPVEQFHFAFTEIARQVRLDCIGVLTVYKPSEVEDPEIEKIGPQEDGESWPRVPNLVFQGKKAGSHADDIRFKIGAEARAVSSFGYGGIGSYRFPVTKIDGEYAEVVIDPVKDTRTWVSLKNVGTRPGVKGDLVLFEKCTKETMIDPFFFTQSKVRKLYSEPGLNSKITNIKGGDQNYVAGEFIDGFIVLKVEASEEEGWWKKIGWIRVRDDDGLLMIWVMEKDLC